MYVVRNLSTSGLFALCTHTCGLERQFFSQRGRRGVCALFWQDSKQSADFKQRNCNAKLSLVRQLQCEVVAWRLQSTKASRFQTFIGVWEWVRL